MKTTKLLLTVSLISVAFAVKAQVYEDPASGNVGIGITTIDNAQGWGKVLQLHGMSSSKLLVTESSGVKLGMFAHPSYHGKIGTESNHNLTFMTGYWNDVMTLTTARNVGIGTTDPSTKLDLKGDLTIDGSDQSRIYMSNSPVDLNKYLLLLNSTANGSASGLKAGGLLVSDTYSFANPNKNDLVVKGNVGIGVGDTRGYKLAIAGNMIAESVKVQLQGSWPDYVFAKDYQLPTLQETEIHIKDKGHLPGIPSAAEVKTNGIDLGEMNAKLLQKIEELTLQMIGMNKMILSLQEQMLKK